MKNQKITELKSEVYDLIVQIEQYQVAIQQLVEVRKQKVQEIINLENQLNIPEEIKEEIKEEIEQIKE